MPSSLPHSVREAWGDEATDDFERWLESMLQDRAVPRDEYREVLSRLDVLENDVEHIQADLANLRTDVQDLRAEVHGLRSEINERFDRINQRFDQMYDRMLVTMRWTVGTIALFGTLITVLLAAEFT